MLVLQNIFWVLVNDMKDCPHCFCLVWFLVQPTSYMLEISLAKWFSMELLLVYLVDVLVNHWLKNDDKSTKNFFLKFSGILFNLETQMQFFLLICHFTLLSKQIDVITVWPWFDFFMLYFSILHRLPGLYSR